MISDIFGRTPAFETLCKELSQTAPKVHPIDPYKGVDPEFETEALAYEYFMAQVGLEQYQSILMDSLSRSGPDTVLIGFSIGASVIWKISGRPLFRHIKKAFCFYGSQIRLNASIDPLFDIELLFPEQEPHFDVDELISMLKGKSRVTCSKAKGLHGFMNKLSPHFDPACYSVFMAHLKTSLIHLESHHHQTLKGTP